MDTASPSDYGPPWLGRVSRPLLGVSIVIGIIALGTAVAHMWHQARAGAPHIDRMTPLALAIASLCKMPHSLYVHDRTMLALQAAFTFGWIAVLIVSMVKPDPKAKPQK